MLNHLQTTSTCLSPSGSLCPSEHRFNKVLGEGKSERLSACSTIQSSWNLPACCVLADGKAVVPERLCCLERGRWAGDFSEHVIHHQYFPPRGLEGSSRTCPEDRRSLLDQNSGLQKIVVFTWCWAIGHFKKENTCSWIINPCFSFCLLPQQTNACLFYMYKVGVTGEGAGPSKAKVAVSNYLC